MSERSIQQAVELLNELLRLEPQAISDLFRHRVKFTSQELADHPTVQVGIADNAKYKGDGSDVFDLGILGLLNGIFGTETDRISIQVDDDFYDKPEKTIEYFNAHIDWGTSGRRT